MFQLEAPTLCLSQPLKSKQYAMRHANRKEFHTPAAINPSEMEHNLLLRYTARFTKPTAIAILVWLDPELESSY